MKKPKVTKAQKAAIDLIRESGDMVVIENNWIVYTATGRQCVFGVGSDSQAVALLRDGDMFERCDRDTEADYVSDRRADAKQHGKNAIALIKAGRYYDGMVEAESAESTNMDSDVSVELYRLK